MPPTEERFQGRDGVEFHGRRWEIFPAKGLCFLIHGFAEHSGRYSWLAQKLNSRGYSVYALDQRGHGLSSGARGDCRSLAELVDDIDAWVRKVRDCSPGTPAFLIGHSLGGLITLAYAADHPQGLAGVAVSSPLIRLGVKLPAAKKAFIRMLGRLMPGVSLPNGVVPDHLSHDPSVVETYRSDPLIFRTITAGCAVALDRAMACTDDLAGRIRIPCLILQAGDDRVCSAQAADAFAKRADPTWVTFRRYEGLYHEIFNEPQKETVAADLSAWLDSLAR
ncbi:MAG: lysophospholipase [Candidatus Omnitrophica bacterium]|nr:lysophospholipase [Candidatus Omnitrophota bacterium]